MFHGAIKRYNLGIFIERSTRVEYFLKYYVFAISFIIYAYCLHYPKGIDKRVTRLILILTLLDFIHLFLFSMRGYGIAKIGIAFLILFLYNKYKKNG